MPKAKSSINEKMSELDTLLTWFDGDEFELEEAVEKFTKAQELAASIEHDLNEMKNTITVISERFDGLLLRMFRHRIGDHRRRYLFYRFLARR